MFDCGLHALAATLAEPEEAGDIELLTSLWRHTELVVQCRRPSGLEDQPDLAVRIRGAFGRALALLPPPISHRSDPFHRARPFEVLFGDFDVGTAQQLPKPFVLGVDCFGDRVDVTLKMFGHAQFWAAQACDALVMALEEGVSIRSESRHRIRFTVVDCTGKIVDGLEKAPSSNEVVLSFRSPLVVRQRAAFGLSERSLVNGLLSRVSGLARWQGIALRHDSCIRENINSLTADGSGLIPVILRRHSQRQPGSSIPIAGASGKLTISGPLEVLTDYFLIGAQIHIGSHAAIGFARYVPAFYS